ncbi:sugar ABC transporter substrate-binding protein [Rhodococcus sp. 06-418-5]|jgi:fructose transport system substrate-binding protein|uniref:substrate-binding domain-containing protein n=1 Tax=Nocardiaceae TaxID=85025 RepID=UPI00050CD1CA|nr:MULTISPECIES: substrate-binding domain-containing protein [Rhodococcus]OZC87552.1 sugar ABC transporter substrate-binding protein [Rhodococcus sp. 06-418-5]OZD85528.1 sugar ABC transporter substrate-binding protein [Rhodococcus sp. 05-339-2]OZE06537.1 sugar ABC transporter substrate-binding protein [Rhodococcus sp. 05-2255-3C]OZE06989.1 sugar ABC transporter substrate-binding protein [Rhodococcus sp. 05-2255-3B1]OZE24003.1 sugar ABC transporter substrate-binding protein [Rhodococcus sp. 05-
MFNHRRKSALTIGTVLMAGSLVLGLTACSSSDSDSVKVGLITKTDSNPYFVKLREAAQAKADSSGAELVALAGAFDGDNEGQVAAIENLVGQGVKGILITPNSSTGVLDAIKKARDAGVVVIALDTATDPEDAVDATFATDNKAAGVSQGAWVKGTLGTTAPQVIMLDGTAGGTVDTFRHDGFLEGMGLTDSSPEIVGQENTNGDQTKAQTAMENLLQRAPGVNALYTINEPAAAGAYQAIQSAGRADQITIGSIDGSCTGIANVKSGIIGATVLQFPAKMAEQGVDAVVKFAQDGTKPSGFNDTGSQLVTDKPVAGIDSQDTAWGEANCWG